MTRELAFHYPPDVFDAVVDAVPLLTRSKKGRRALLPRMWR
jgi:hypothetical protein